MSSRRPATPPRPGPPEPGGHDLRPRLAVDLPNHSVLVGGLDYWTRGEEIARAAAGREARAAPRPPRRAPAPRRRRQGGPDRPETGITAWQFPEWFITQDVRLGADRPHVARGCWCIAGPC